MHATTEFDQLIESLVFGTGCEADDAIVSFETRERIEEEYSQFCGSLLIGLTQKNLA